jgi:hypothetical protein
MVLPGVFFCGVKCGEGVGFYDWVRWAGGGDGCGGAEVGS